MLCRTSPLVAALFLSAAAFSHGLAAASEVRALETPGEGIQPQLVVDRDTLHLIYFSGDEVHGDINYVRSVDAGLTFGKPLRVNQTEGSAVAIGNIRGAHLAVGKNGRPHVAWMGSDKAAETGPDGATPMLYTRLGDDGQGFERERNLIQFAAGLDGGGSIAADRTGNVYVAWHAAVPGGRTEQERTVWVSRSSDDGRTFARETKAAPENVGACGCCGMRAFADSNSAVYMLYRGAIRRDQRDMYLLASKDGGQVFSETLLRPWKIEACPMSSASFAEGPNGVVAAFESDNDVFAARLSPGSEPSSMLRPAVDGTVQRRHPAVATNTQGEVLLAWVEGMTWKTSGNLRWSLFSPDGQEINRSEGSAKVKTWGVVSATALSSGDFLVVH